MSFILDALRKSDSERQQQVEPRLASPRQGVSAPVRSRWPAILIVALVLNAIAMAWLVLANRSETAPVAAAETARVATISPAPAPPAPSLRHEAQLTEPAVTATMNQPADTAPAAAPRQAAEPVNAATFAPPSDAVAAPASDDATQKMDRIRSPALPTFEQLIVGGVLSMPPLRLDMHVYSGDPAERFVFINMNKYREGEQIEEGPVVDEITADGVILSEQGNRFTLNSN